MYLDSVIESNIKDNRLYGLSKPTIIKEILKLPVDINIKKLDSNIDDFYDSFYIKKSSLKKEEKNKYQTFLNVEKEKNERFKEIPVGEKSTNYRKIVTINKDWLKKSQRKFNKILMNILLDKKVRGKKQTSIIPYLHSAVKQRSFHTNAKVHIGNKYVLAIDLKDFYPSVTKYKIYLFFKKYFNLPSDIAMFYAVISTCKADDGSYRLGQGLSQSSTLAYLVNFNLFNYIYNLALNYNIDMSVYVDDVIFSSKDKIPQEFINKLFGIFKKNNMQIKRNKVHNYKKNSVKKITGVYLNGNKTRVANKKHEEFNYQYNYLIKAIKNINTIDDYFKIYNLYIKFNGNYQHIKMVENRVHQRYENFIKEYDTFFPRGINKKNKNQIYNVKNIKCSNDLIKLNSCFQKLKNKENKIVRVD